MNKILIEQNGKVFDNVSLNGWDNLLSMTVEQVKNLDNKQELVDQIRKAVVKNTGDEKSGISFVMLSENNVFIWAIHISTDGFNVIDLNDIQNHFKN